MPLKLVSIYIYSSGKLYSLQICSFQFYEGVWQIGNWKFNGIRLPLCAATAGPQNKPRVLTEDHN